jgi:glutamate synthase (NADPH/NADH) small chain
VLDADFVIDCDTVIIAVGTRPNPLLKAAAPGIELSRRGYVVTDEDGATNLPGVFSGGDIVTGSATVILAMGAGKKSARAMDRWLRERPVS